MRDLEPTQRIPTLPAEPADVSQDVAPAYDRGSRLGGLWSGLVRLLLVLLLAAGGLIAAALLLTPTRQAVLIMGSDARPDELKRGAVGRTDSLMLLVADRAEPRLALVSVPRDLWVAIPGHGEERINAAFELGGDQAAKQTVSNVLGQRVDRYLLIGLQGVRDIVDAVGGVDITVEQPIHDDAYPTDDYGYMTVDIPAGRQHMDGETALEYARTRHQDSDFGRIARQQRVLSAVRSAMLNPLNWPRVPATLLAIQRAIHTDLSPLDAIALGAATLRNPGEPDRLVIDTTLVAPMVGQGGAYLLQPRPELRSAVARFLGETPTSAARVEILNGAGVAGLARTTADRLSRQGFSISSVGDADRPQAQTTILAQPEARRAAEAVARALDLPSSRVSDAAPPGSADVRVILGSDAR